MDGRQLPSLSRLQASPSPGNGVSHATEAARLARAAANALILTLYVGAAKDDAIKRGKREELKAALFPNGTGGEGPVETYRRTGDTLPTIEAIATVLEVQWCPRGTWAEQIFKLRRGLRRT